MSAAKL